MAGASLVDSLDPELVRLSLRQAQHWAPAAPHRVGTALHPLLCASHTPAGKHSPRAALALSPAENGIFSSRVVPYRPLNEVPQDGAPSIIAGGHPGEGQAVFVHIVALHVEGGSWGTSCRCCSVCKTPSEGFVPSSSKIFLE